LLKHMKEIIKSGCKNLHLYLLELRTFALSIFYESFGPKIV